LQGYQAIATFHDETGESDAHLYARQLGQESKYEQVVEEMESPVYWEVWFFRPLERTMWYVRVGVDGRVIDFQRVLPEEAAGNLPPERGKPRVTLSPAQARQLAERYLTEEQKYDLRAWRLIETDSVERPNRTDYWFTYEHRQYRIGEAPYRMRVEVQGATAQNISLWWELPERWHFERQRFRAWGVFAAAWIVVLVMGLVAHVIYWEWREGTVTSFSWRLVLATLPVALLALLLFMLSQGKTLVWSRYDPAEPPLMHLLITLVVLGILVVLLALFIVTLYAGFEPHYWRLRLGHLVPLSVWLSPQRWGEAPPDSPLRHPKAMREGVLVALLISAVLGLIMYHSATDPPSLDAEHLWLEVIAMAALITLLFGGLALAAVGTYRRYIRSVWRLALLALAFAPAVAIGAESWETIRERLQDYALGWAIVALGGFWLGRRILQGNFVSWT
ncbi:MAG: hypothetical protein NZL85_01465, partial [Fimbriimonadales bacterium]|nr:hypothetical protein [Fimbriimonadales bacterium]